MPSYAYARMSTTDQDLGLREAALRVTGCDVIRAEKVSGASCGGWAELATLLDFIGVIAEDVQKRTLNVARPPAPAQPKSGPSEPVLLVEKDFSFAPG